MPTNRGTSVLVIGVRIPTPDLDSGSLRLFRILQILAQISRDTCFLAVCPFNQPLYSSRLKDDRENLRNVGIIVPEGREEDPEAFLRTRGQKFAMVILSDEFVAHRYLTRVRRYCPEALVVFDTVDLHYLRLYREALITRNRRLVKMAIATRKRELQAVEKSDVTLVTSTLEHQKLSTMFPHEKIKVLSNIHEVSTVGGLSFEQRQGLLFIGSFSHGPNLDALSVLMKIFPRLQEAIPGLILRIAGADPPGEILRNNPHREITFLGHVPDLLPLFHRSRLSVAPLRFGAGVKGKVLESMACGLPVVATPVAAEGLGASNGRHLAVAELEEEFISQVINTYNRKSQWQSFRSHGRALIEEKFSSSAVIQVLEELLAGRKP